MPLLAAVALIVLATALWGGGGEPSARAPAARDGADHARRPPATRTRSTGAAAPLPARPLDAEVDADVDAAPPIAAVRLDDLQASVRAFYETLPEGWQMPSQIRVDEVLPADAVDILGVPPESLLDELSHYPLSMRTGLELVLDMTSGDDSVGVAIILPSGRRYLDVLAIVPAPDGGPPGR